MSAPRFPTILAWSLLLALGDAAQAQQSSPRIGYVFPAGGRQGSSLMVMIGGRYLDGATRATVSGEGVQAKVVEYARPTRPEQVGTLVSKLTRLEQKKAAATKSGNSKASKSAWTAEDEMLMLVTKRKVATVVGGQPAPAIAENVVVQVTIAPHAEPGHREIRLETPKGLTNPVVFCVGQLPEFFKEANISEEVRSGKNLSRYRDEPRISSGEPPTKIALPAVGNGQIMPGGADRYAFEARKGQRLVIAASAQELIPYISDAVPGWFQAILTLYDDQGRELAYADHFRFHPDPVLNFEVPRDGSYVIEIRDSIYRGRDDFVYRLTVGETAFLTGIFPLGGRAGAKTSVEIAGWNLPAGRLDQDAQDKAPGVYPLRVQKGDVVSNALPFAVDTLPECLEKEPNNTPAAAQAVTLPIIVNGRIDPPDDIDAFRFEGRAGDSIVAEVYARRLGSPVDSVLRLTDAAGKQLALNDDTEDSGAGLTTHHADSYLRVALPADGTYYLHLADAQHQGGPEYAYRLRIGPPRPDFDLRIVPSSFSLRGSATVPVTVHALRKDGFAGAIAVELKDPPDGVMLLGEGVPAGQDQAKVTLKVVSAGPTGPINLALEGTATIDGRQVSHTAVPAEDMTQAFEYRHLVPAQELKLAVSGRSGSPSSITVLSQTPIKIPADGTARVRIYVPSRLMPAKVALELRRPPEGITLKDVSTGRERIDVVFQSDPEKVKPGMKGTLSLGPPSEKPPAAGKGKSRSSPPRSSQATLPGIPFEIVGR